MPVLDDAIRHVQRVAASQLEQSLEEGALLLVACFLLLACGGQTGSAPTAAPSTTPTFTPSQAQLRAKAKDYVAILIKDSSAFHDAATETAKACQGSLADCRASLPAEHIILAGWLRDLDNAGPPPPCLKEIDATVRQAIYAYDDSITARGRMLDSNGPDPVDEATWIKRTNDGNAYLKQATDMSTQTAQC